MATQKVFMVSERPDWLKKLIFWGRVQLKLIFVGLIAVLVFCFGIIITLLAVIFAPFFGWLKTRKFETKFYRTTHSRKESPKGDFIDVEYEIIEEERKDKDK